MKALTGKLQINFVMPAQFQEPETEAEKVLLSSGTEIVLFNVSCKCYRGALVKGSGGLTLKLRKRLVSSARCAIRTKLKDLTHHCFGNHSNCSSAQLQEIGCWIAA